MSWQASSLGWCGAVGVMVCPSSAALADIPTLGRHFGKVAQASPQVIRGMTRQAVERFLQTQPDWESSWPCSGGQYWAAYSQAVVRVYYGPDDRVLHVGKPSDSLPAPGMNTFESGDW
jgi:hypothetical protein